MVELYEEGDSIRGDRVRAEARKISKPLLFNKSGRHKAQHITLWENVFCKIEKKIRFHAQSGE